jgi:hypothetical protein
MITTTATAKCTRCGRTLTSLRSIALGYGPTCARRITAAAAVVDLDAYKTFQVTKAIELIAERAIVAAGRTSPTVFLAVSSRGDATYQVDTEDHTCSCPAGESGRTCYHLAAADILAAA